MTEAIIDNPTYLKDVRHFFVEEDLIHMSRRGHDLSTYQGLKNDANSVLQLTAPPDATMPPPETGRAWSAERNQSFLNWMTNGLPSVRRRCNNRSTVQQGGSERTSAISPQTRLRHWHAPSVI